MPLRYRQASFRRSNRKDRSVAPVGVVTDGWGKQGAQPTARALVVTGCTCALEN